MASDLEYVAYVAAQMEGAGPITYRKMFGEYAVYCRGKVVALVCDNQLFVKPTATGRSFIGNPTEAPAYPGAKNSFLIEERLDDRAWLGELIRITERELPAAKSKKIEPAARAPQRKSSTKKVAQSRQAAPKKKTAPPKRAAHSMQTALKKKTALPKKAAHSGKAPRAKKAGAPSRAPIRPSAKPTVR